FVAAGPAGAAARLRQILQGDAVRLAVSGTLLGRAGRVAGSGTHPHPVQPLRGILGAPPPPAPLAALELPFHPRAARIERAQARWFSSGPIVPAVLASCAVPGLLPPVEIDGEHFFDGGLVHSIPVGHAIALGAGTIYVLHVGRIERPLTVPRRPWEVGLVAFEIARRHRFHEEMSAVPADVRVHILPAGTDRRPPDLSQLRYRDTTRVAAGIERADTASARALAELARPRTGP